MPERSVSVTFQSKHPHRTCWLAIRWAGEEPAALFTDLQALGWTRHTAAPPLAGTHDVAFGKEGTGLFRGWTPGERKANLAQARRVLRRHGFTRVPVQRLDLQDLL
jgi:hypothetical protein